MESKESEKKLYNVLLNEEHINKFDKIAEKTHRKKADLIRKWIDDNFKEEYKD